MELAILSYHLQRQCGNVRPHSTKCGNTWAVDDIENWACETQPPAVICSKAGMPEQTLDCSDYDFEVELPPVMVARVEMHDCLCGFPPDDIAMYLVGESDLLPGEAAAWQSRRFIWYDFTEHDECQDQRSAVLPLVQYYVSFRFSITGSVGSCSGRRLAVQVHVPGSFCGGTDELLFGPYAIGPGFGTAEQILSVSMSINFDRAAIGCGSSSGNYWFCGFLPGELPFAVGYEGNGPAMEPDHYVTLSVSFPPPETEG